MRGVGFLQNAYGGMAGLGRKRIDPLEAGEGGLGHFMNPLCDIPSHCGFFAGPWAVTRSSLSRAALGQCYLTAAAACVLRGVVSALAESSSWRGL